MSTNTQIAILDHFMSSDKERLRFEGGASVTPRNRSTHGQGV